MHSFPSGHKTSGGGMLTALHFVLHLRLNAAEKGLHLFVHLLILINRGYAVFPMSALLSCTCAYLLSLQMALTWQNAEQKKEKDDATLEGINLNGGISSPAWIQQQEETRTFCDPSAAGELHTSSGLIDKSKLVWWSSDCVFWRCDLCASRPSVFELEVERATPWERHHILDGWRGGAVLS